jgi:hypothetical protein
MTPKVFHERFSDLIQSALSENPVPLSQMILELEKAKIKCVNIQLSVEAHQEQIESARRIIPANGRIEIKN